MIEYSAPIRRRRLLSSYIFLLRHKCASFHAPIGVLALTNHLFHSVINPHPSFRYSRRMTQSHPSPIHSESTLSSSSSELTSCMKKEAKLVSATSSSLSLCGDRLRNGLLVSFPTETVYGLGCHALDPLAVQRVFDAKERPLSDPLIVHVIKGEDALALWDASSEEVTDNLHDLDTEQKRIKYLERQALIVLTNNFFPGPLTIVAQAKPSIPQILMANTGYVACRSPSHPIARALISCAKCPIAAPSANKFGHVSPTLAKHVMDDLADEDVWIIDPTLGYGAEKDLSESQTDNVNQDEVVCQVGVESTVAKVQMHTLPNEKSATLGTISILRHGAISSKEIKSSLKSAKIDQYFQVIDAVQYTPETINNVAPGQTVRHYSPNIPCFMIGLTRQQSTFNELSDEEKKVLSKSVIIDYDQKLVQYQPYALAYHDLSPSGNSETAAATVFQILRWSERVHTAARVFVPDLASEVFVEEKLEQESLLLALKDKLTRAASGIVLITFQ